MMVCRKFNKARPTGVSQITKLTCVINIAQTRCANAFLLREGLLLTHHFKIQYYNKEVVDYIGGVIFSFAVTRC